MGYAAAGGVTWGGWLGRARRIWTWGRAQFEIADGEFDCVLSLFALLHFLHPEQAARTHFLFDADCARVAALPGSLQYRCGAFLISWRKPG